MSALSNSEALKQELEQQAYEFGKREGDGLLARIDFTKHVCARAKDGEIVVDDAETTWAAFQRGARARAHEIGGPPPSSTELGQRASDLKHYVTLGANTTLDGPELLDNACDLLARMRDEGTAKGLRTWDIMLVWLRKQNASPERVLTDGEIRDLFLERAKRATDELDRLSSVLNVLNKQTDIYENERVAQAEEQERAETDPEADPVDPDVQTEGVQGVYTARDLIQDRIAELGGTRKEQRKQARAIERARKEALKQAAKEARENA